MDRLGQAIVASVDAPAALWRVLAGLFAGIDSLGSSPAMVVGLLRDAGVGRGDRVIELACGKGAVAVAAARRLGCSVIGVDGAAAFVGSARGLARRRGVERLARFVHADVRALPRDVARARYDGAMMIGLFGLVEAARVLRGLARRGGVYVVDDCFFDPRRGGAGRGGVGHGGVGHGGAGHRVLTMEGCNARIAALGDRVERVAVPAPSAVREMHDRLAARLALNVARIGKERPALKGALREFERRQRRAGRVLSGAVRPAVWVVRRG